MYCNDHQQSSTSLPTKRWTTIFSATQKSRKTIPIFSHFQNPDKILIPWRIRMYGLYMLKKLGYIDGQCYHNIAYIHGSVMGDIYIFNIIHIEKKYYWLSNTVISVICINHIFIHFPRKTIPIFSPKISCHFIHFPREKIPKNPWCPWDLWDASPRRPRRW